MRAFITGGTGFVGANLVAALADCGITAVVLRRQGSSLAALEELAYESVFGDVLDPPDALAAAMKDCQWVFHVAAVSDYWRKSVSRLYQVNVEGTRNVLAAAQRAKVERFVFTSSLAAMGIPENGQVVDESHQFNLDARRWPYGHTKFLAEQEVGQAVRRGLEAVTVNVSLALGPRDVNQISGSVVVEVAKGRLLFNLPGGVNVVSVDDVVAGHIAAAERGRIGERYILGGENLTHRELTDIICDVVGRQPPMLQLPRWVFPPAAFAVAAGRRLVGNLIPYDELQTRMAGKTLFADCRKARTQLGLPQTPVRKAVQEAFDWYNNHGYFD